MRIFSAGLALEANTFSPLPTSYQAFVEKLYFPPGKHPPTPTHQTAAFFVARERAKSDGYELIEGSCYAAQPGGTVNRDAYERMRDEILDQLKAAGPVDGVILALHGAMVAQGYDDCEGDILERVRAIVGAKVVIGVELDPHCHLTVKRCRLADVIVLYKEYPHTDFIERGHEVVTMVVDAIRGKIQPVMSLWDCRLIQSFPTTIQPMRGLVDKCSALEGKNGVLSVSIGHGFSAGDVPENDARILVVTDNAKAHGDKLAEELGRELFSIKEAANPPFLTPDEAITEALKLSGPVVIADTTDNAGGGAPSDNTTFLHRLIARGVAGASVGPVWDPLAVRLAFDAGVGAKLPFRFGGKVAKVSGPPVDADVEVIACVRNARQTFAGAPVPIGDAAAIRTKEGVGAVLISTRAQAMGHDLFGNLGIEPTKERILVVKSNQHFYASYSQIASKVLYADGDGLMVRDPRNSPWKRVERPIWPLDERVEGRLLL
jgi:microcystin degradation protein MlrC